MESSIKTLLILSRSSNKYGRHRQFLFLIGRFLKIWNRFEKWTETWWKVIYKDCSFRPDPLTNMVQSAIPLSGRSISKIFSAETAWLNKVKFYRSHLWFPWASLLSDWLKYVFSSEVGRHNQLLLYMNDTWEILSNFPYFVPIVQLT